MLGDYHVIQDTTTLNADITNEEVRIALTSALKGKALGEDGVPLEVLLNEECTVYLSKLFNKNSAELLTPQVTMTSRVPWMLLVVLLVAQPSLQQTIPTPDLSCLNMPFILGVVKCYVGGITVRMFADDAAMENIQTTEEPESGGLPFGVHNLKIKITGFSSIPDQVSPIRQTPIPGVEHLDRVQEHLQAAKSNLEWAAHSFHRGLLSEAKTQEEILRVVAFEKELLQQLDGVDPNLITEYFATSVAEQVAEFQKTLSYITKVIKSHVTDEMVEEHQKVEGLAGIQDLEDNIPAWILAIACAAEPRLCTALDMAQVIIDCLNTYDRNDYENGLKWAKCFFDCDSVDVFVPCVNNKFDSCGGIAWVGDVLNKALIQYLELEECIVLEMLPPDDTRLLDIINGDLPPGVMPYDFIIDEGEDAFPVKIANNMPPASFCFDFKELLGSGLVMGVARILGSYLLNGKICSVSLEVWTSNYMDALRGHNIVHAIPFTADFVFGGPLCRDGFLLSQLKIGEHGYNVEGANQCKFKLDRDNWNGNITIPVRATADMKTDGDQDVFMTVKLVVGGLHAKTMRAKVLVHDNDAVIPDNMHDTGTHSVCRSTSDPHITTFDGRYYNNMYLGYFILYRNQHLPYEVQIIYQRCSTDQTSEATCNCGVAVRSGDDVFVAERCRRDDGADQPIRAQLYLNGDLTLGTFIYSEFDGLRYQIVLPHGETVLIVVDEHPNVINVMVKPSAFDHGTGRTEGLCGQHTGSSTDCFLMPDGSIYLGEGTDEGQQPFGFIEAYRAEDANRMFEGVAPITTEFDNGRYCRCHFMPILGPQCRCDTNIAEMCDMVVGDDVTATFVGTALPSVPGQGLDGVTLDKNFVPGYMPSWDDSDISEKSARNDCKDYSDDHEMIKEYRRRVCPLIGECWPNERVEFGCMDDILLTQDYQWMRTTREAVKDQVLDREIRELLKTNKEIREISNLMCLNDCNDNGACVEGRCQCESGWSGATCDIASASNVKVTDVTELCDITAQACSYVSITGFNFDRSMECQLKAFEATPAGPVYSGSEVTSESVFISQNQIFCNIPDDSSYTVTLTGSEQSVNFIPYDGATTTCNVKNMSCTAIHTAEKRRTHHNRQ